MNKWIHDLPGEIGASAMPLDRAPQLAGKARVHIVALGDVGTTMLIGSGAYTDAEQTVSLARQAVESIIASAL